MALKWVRSDFRMDSFYTKRLGVIQVERLV